MRKVAVVVLAISACGRSTPPSPPAPPAPSSSEPARPPPPSSAAPSASPAPPTPPSLSADAEDEIDWRVTGGYDSKARIVDLVSAHGGGSRDLVSEAVDRKLAEHAAKEASWKGRTDVEKIEAVFAALEKERILARTHYGANQDEANAEMEEEVKKLRASGKSVRGWVYFAEDATEMAVREGTLLILYGATGPADASWEVIAAAIEARLKAAGLKAEWPYRSAAYPIRVTGLEWRKRRTPR